MMTCRNWNGCCGIFKGWGIWSWHCQWRMWTIKWYVNLSFAVYEDCHGHIQTMMMLGKGAVYLSSNKQKINTQHSTESELVCSDDLMPEVLCCWYFIQAQGHEIEDNIVFQYNTNCIQLMKNEAISSLEHAKHMQDKIVQGEINLK